MNSSLNKIRPAVLAAAAECLKTIAHPRRLEILVCLENGSRNVSEIMEATGLLQAVTSEHLRLMEARGILTACKKGRMVYYSLALPELKSILDCIRSKKLKRSS